MMFFDPDRPSWKVLGRVWPHKEVSRFADVSGMRWHIQEMGCGPTLLLVHGSGASTHSWRAMMPALTAHFHVVAIDLPGHAFSTVPDVYRPTLHRVSSLLAELIESQGWDVGLAVGHSAGAAILARMVLDKRIAPAGLISFNGAFQPFDGAAGAVFPALAKLLFLNPLAPRVFAFGGRNRARIESLIAGTGSTLDDEGIKLYQLLIQSPGHVAGVLGMMANWELSALMKALPELPVPMLLVAAENDKAVPAKVSVEVAENCPNAQLDMWPRLGHLAHEEDPEKAVACILSYAKALNILQFNEAQP